jgi:hypothetical protein
MHCENRYIAAFVQEKISYIQIKLNDFDVFYMLAKRILISSSCFLLMSPTRLTFFRTRHAVIQFDFRDTSEMARYGHTDMV